MTAGQTGGGCNSLDKFSKHSFKMALTYSKKISVEYRDSVPVGQLYKLHIYDQLTRNAVAFYIYLLAR